MIKFEQSQALNSDFESFWSIVHCAIICYNILQKITKKRGAFQTLQGLAFSLLDQWFSSETKKANQRPRSNKVEENNSITEVSQTHPMRYLFLLGVLPTTFGSLYSLGYTPIRKFMYSVEITEIYSYTVLTKISRKQRFNYRTQCGFLDFSITGSLREVNFEDS